MSSEILTKQGRIKKRFQPSIYFDSSVLIDYWITEGADVDIPDEPCIPERPLLSAARDILRSDVRFSKVAEIRKKLVSTDVKVSCVISPLAIIELTEWHAEAKFKNIAAEASGVLSIQRKSKKEIGSLLSEVLEKRKRKEEVKNNIKGPYGSSTGLEVLHAETWLNPSFAKAHGFNGLFEVDLINFKLDIPQTFDLPFLFAYLQMGLADILHVMAARHLGCTYIASFDSDYSRNKKHIEEGAKLKLLSSPEDILKAIAG